MQATIYKIFGLPFLRHLTVVYLAVLLLLTQADAITSWTLLKAQLAERPPWQIALMFTGLLTIWSVACGGAFRVVWRQPVIRFLLRQPLSYRDWARLLVVPMLPALIFAPVIWYLAPQHIHPLLHYASVLLLPAPIILATSLGGWRSVLMIAVNVLTIALLIFVYQYVGWIALPMTVAGLVMMPLVLPAMLTRHSTTIANIESRSLTAASPLKALVKRDLRCLLRTERKSLSGLGQTAIVLLLMMFALRVNGEISGKPAFLAVGILFGLIAAMAYDVLEKLSARLDSALFRLEWPIDPAQRWMSLLILMLLILGLPWLGFAALGSRMEWWFPLSLLQMVTISCLMVTIFSLRLHWRHKDSGMAVWGLMLLAYEIGMALTPVVFVLLSGALIAISTPIAVRSLRSFAIQQSIERNFQG